MKILTITVPAYNMEKYIKRCLDSMIVPEIMDKLEVIVINDGSTDSTLEIIREYEKQYPDTFIVVDKENGGHGSGINKGIELATGRYFKVVDADDWVDSKALTELVEYLKDCNSDIVSTHFNIISITKGYIGCKYCKNVEFGHKYSIDEIASKNIKIAMHSITYRTSLLKNRVRIQENTFFVDNEYNLLPIPYVNTIEFFNAAVYQYFIGRPDQSMANENIGRYNEHLIKVVKHLIAFYNETEMSSGQRQYVFNYLRKFIAPIYHDYAVISKEYIRNVEKAREFDRYLKQANFVLYKAVNNMYIIALRKTDFKLVIPLSFVEPIWRFKIKPFLSGIKRQLIK